MFFRYAIGLILLAGVVFGDDYLLDLVFDKPDPFYDYGIYSGHGWDHMEYQTNVGDDILGVSLTVVEGQINDDNNAPTFIAKDEIGATIRTDSRGNAKSWPRRLYKDTKETEYYVSEDMFFSYLVVNDNATAAFNGSTTVADLITAKGSGVQVAGGAQTGDVQNTRFAGHYFLRDGTVRVYIFNRLLADFSFNKYGDLAVATNATCDTHYSSSGYGDFLSAGEYCGFSDITDLGVHNITSVITGPLDQGLPTTFYFSEPKADSDQEISYMIKYGKDDYFSALKNGAISFISASGLVGNDTYTDALSSFLDVSSRLDFFEDADVVNNALMWKNIKDTVDLKDGANDSDVLKETKNKFNFILDVINSLPTSSVTPVGKCSNEYVMSELTASSAGAPTLKTITHQWDVNGDASLKRLLYKFGSSRSSYKPETNSVSPITGADTYYNYAHQFSITGLSSEQKSSFKNSEYISWLLGVFSSQYPLSNEDFQFVCWDMNEESSGNVQFSVYLRNKKFTQAMISYQNDPNNANLIAAAKNKEKSIIELISTKPYGFMLLGTDSTLSVPSILEGTGATSVFVFKDNGWKTQETEKNIPPFSGFWIFMEENQDRFVADYEITKDVETSLPPILLTATLPSGWHLLGTGAKIEGRAGLDRVVGVGHNVRIAWSYSDEAIWRYVDYANGRQDDNFYVPPFGGFWVLVK